MKKPFLIACCVVLGLFVLALVGGLFLSPEWSVTRTRTIAAPVSTIHATVADLHTWPEWTSWGQDAGEEAIWSFEGAPAGAGAVMRWTAPRFGEGHLRALKADSGGMDYEMVLQRDGGTTIVGQVAYRPVAGGTEVSWTDSGAFGWNPLLRLFRGPFETTYGEGLEGCLQGLAGRVESSGR